MKRTLSLLTVLLLILSTASVLAESSLADGLYEPAAFSWSGGTGRVSLSCEGVRISSGQPAILVRFSSSKYSYVKSGGATYYPSSTEHGSLFEFPIELGVNNSILAMTTAMSSAHEIEYTLFVTLSDADAPASGDTVAELLSDFGLSASDKLQNGAATLFSIYPVGTALSAVMIEGHGIYLIAPTDYELPAGIETAPRISGVIRTPIEGAFIAGTTGAAAWAEAVLPQTESLQIADAPDYPALLLSGCSLAVLPSTAASDTDAERFSTLGIPVLYDLSDLERTSAGTAEWSRVYELLFLPDEKGC